MDWLGVGPRSPRRTPTTMMMILDDLAGTLHRKPSLGSSEGTASGLDDHDGWSDEDEDSGPNRNGPGGTAENTSSQEYSDYARGLSYSESEGRARVQRASGGESGEPPVRLSGRSRR